MLGKLRGRLEWGKGGGGGGGGGGTTAKLVGFWLYILTSSNADG